MAPSARLLGRAEPAAVPAITGIVCGDQGRLALDRAGCPVLLLSLRRTASILFDARMAALERWKLTGHHGDCASPPACCQGRSSAITHVGTCQLEACPARWPLPPPVRMRRDIDPWPPTATSPERILCRQVSQSTAYLAADHHRLDSLTRTPPVREPAQQRPDPVLSAPHGPPGKHGHKPRRIGSYARSVTIQPRADSTSALCRPGPRWLAAHFSATARMAASESLGTVIRSPVLRA